MRPHKYRRNYNTFFIKHGFNPWKYHIEDHKYHERLPSGYHVSQTWGGLHKAWVGYCIARDKLEPDREIHYAKVIQKLQKELGLKV